MQLKHAKMSGLDLTVLSSKDGCGEQCPAQDYFGHEGLLRLHTNGAIQFLYNNLQSFHGPFIPYTITLGADGTPILTISIMSLDKFAPHDPNLSKDMPSPTNLQPIAVTASLTNATKSTLHVPKLKLKLIRNTPLIYPVDARQHGIEGEVVMNASIDATGRVREPYVIVSAGPLLDNAALDAIRQWTYTPIVINGVPGYGDITISVGFHLR
ncbi:MAG: energy transducer TonB [Acidobacteriaceae bacterium]